MSKVTALLKKNFILWKRGGICSLIEILLPICFSFLFFVFRGSADVEDVAASSYLNPFIRDKEVVPMPYKLFSDTTVNPNLDKYVFQAPNGTTITVDQTLLMKQCITAPGQDADKHGHIALAPENEFTQQLAQYFQTAFNYETQFYKSADDIFDTQTKENYKEDICLGISFQQSGENNKWKYSIHYNTTADSEDEEIPDTRSTIMNYYKQQNMEEFIDKWVETGVTTLQNWVDNIILKSVTSQSSSIVPYITSARVDKHKDDELPKLLKGNLGTYISLPIVIVFLRFLHQMLDEKEKKIKEAMKIMGLSDSQFFMAWILQYSIVFFIITLGVTILLQVSIFPNSNFLLIFVWYLLFNMNIMAQALLLQSIFSQTKQGIIFGMILYIVLYMVGIIIGESEDYSMGSRTAFSILPQANLSLSGDVFMMVETTQSGIGWDNLGLIVEKFNIGRSLILYVISFFVTSFLALYLDQVVPGEYGSKKHPLFILPCLMRKKKQQQYTEQKDQKQGGNQIKDVVEEIEQRLQEQEQNNEVLKVRGLSKIYSNGKRAVNDLNLTMYKNQISCLLGHNGAGKTSTISMLVGMIDISEGDATAFGYDMKTQMDELRTILGLCPQHDILFPSLTVREHLELFAQFKGVTDKEKMNEEIEQLLIDVDLKFKEHDYTKNLSGGQKRRVSIAIAFIGGSKLVFLDEPTSGCDTSVRRKLWDMLRKYKNDKIIVLTTHFMDEADYLGDRISIMGEGHLICSGSPIYLKNKFGVGYNLKIVKFDTTTASDPIINMVMKHIPSAIKVSDVSAELAFQLEMDTVSKFQVLFDDFDNNKAQLQIANYGISITTIEEVFLKIAHSNSKDQKALKQSLSKQLSREILDQENEQKNENENADNFDLNSVRVKDFCALYSMQFSALIKKRISYFKRDTKSLMCEVVLPCILLILGLWSLTITSGGNSPSLDLSGKIYYDEYGKASPVLYGGQNTVQKSLLDEVAGYFDSKYYSFEYSQKLTAEDFDLEHFEKADQERKGSYFFNQLSQSSNLFQSEYLVFAESLNKDVVPLYLNEMNQALLRKATGNKDFTLDCVIHPFKETKKSESATGSDKGVMAAFVFSIVLSFIPASLIVLVVKEKEDQVKHQLGVSGVLLPAYWFSNYVVDLIKYLFPVATIAICMLYAYDLQYFVKEGNTAWAVILLIIFYGTAIIPFTYLTGFIFRNYGNAQVMTFFLHFLLGGLSPMIIFFIRTSIDSAKDAMIVLGYFFKLVPSYAFGNGVILIASRENLMHVDDDYDEIPNSFEMNIAGGDIYFLLICSVLYTIGIFFVENLKSKGALDSVSKAGCPEYIPKLLDDDVQRELQEVEQSQLDDYVVRVNKIRKVFKVNGKHLPAVDQVSFGIKNGECFTLLGVNGAGKTTLFKMLSGDHKPTTGSAHIKGHDIKTDMSNARFHIGYCPQFDALLDKLTSREHLELYAAIKGIPQRMRKELIDQQIKEMELSKYEHVCAGTYSGGNKRKLSVAIAIMGNPPIVFLDEPSTGMDPVARRYMWNVISRITTKRKQSSVILTTHSMEEAEALSTKLGIQVAGQLKCIGNITHVKEKFGGGYEVEIKVDQVTEEELEGVARQVQKNLEDSVTQQNIEGILEKMGQTKKLCLIAPNQQGEELYDKMIGNKLKISELIEFFQLEDRFLRVKDFVSKAFVEYSVIEHFSTYSKFKIETEIPTGQIFGSFEKAKGQLQIASYSVQQATIESIFNQFAVGNINTADYNKGGAKYRAVGAANVKQHQQITKQEEVSMNGQQMVNNQVKLQKQPSNGYIDAQQVQIKNIKQ